MYRLILGGLILAATACPTGAAMATTTAKSEKASVLDVAIPFAEQRHAIEKKLADGKTYGEISSNDRSKVREALSRMSDTFGPVDSVAALTEDQKARIFSDQELVNTILTKAHEESRMVCERIEKVGTHRTTTQCLTVAERRRLRELSQDRVQNQQNAAPVLKNGG